MSDIRAEFERLVEQTKVDDAMHAGYVPASAVRSILDRMAIERFTNLLGDARSPCCAAAVRCGRCGHDLANHKERS